MSRSRRVIEMPPPAAVRRHVEMLRRAEPPIGLLDDVMAQVELVPQARRLNIVPIAAGGTLAAVAAAALAAALLMGPGRDIGVPEPSTPVDRGPEPAATEAPEPRATPEIDALPTAGSVTGVIDVRRGTTLGTMAFGSLWLGNGFDGTVTRIDPATMGVLAEIAVREPNGRWAPMRLVADESSVWAAGDGRASTLVRIDPATNEVVHTVDAGLGSPLAFDIEGDLAWLTFYGGSEVAAISLVDGTVVGRVPRRDASGLVIAFGSVWVSDYGGVGLLRLDPGTGSLRDAGTVLDEIEDIGFESTVIKATDDALWVTGNDGAPVTRVDPDTLQTHTGPRAMRGVAFPDGVAWGAVAYGRIGPLDPATLDFDGVVVLPTDQIFDEQILAGAGSIWVLGEVFDPGVVQLYRIDPGPP